MSYYFKAVFNLNRPVETKASEERNILVKMAASPNFINPPVDYADFGLALDEQDAALAAAQQGGTLNTAILHSKELVVDNYVRKLKSYVTLVAEGDTEIILSSGFRHTKVRQNGVEMPKVEGVEGVRTDTKGELKIRWKRVKNKAFYEVEVRPTANNSAEAPTPDAPANDNSWSTPQATRPASIVIKDLKSLTYYEVRVRAKGASGYGGYSDIVVLLVI